MSQPSAIPKSMSAIAIEGGVGPARALKLVSGTVAVVGADVQRFRVGDPVCALLLGGGYAEYAAVDAHHVLPVPTGVNVVEAAALSETFFTVYANVFERGALKAGETLLCTEAPAASAQRLSRWPRRRGQG